MLVVVNSCTLLVVAVIYTNVQVVAGICTVLVVVNSCTLSIVAVIYTNMLVVAGI